jgi:hypothetical protein
MHLAIILAWLLNQGQWEKNLSILLQHTNMHIHGYVCESKA